MKIICWNCQGVGATLTVRNLKDIIVYNKPKLVFIGETKVKKKKLSNLKKCLKFDNSYIVEA